VPHWIEDVRKYAGSNIVQLLIGELVIQTARRVLGTMNSFSYICLLFKYSYSLSAGRLELD
jgi:hypothetical protein